MAERDPISGLSVVSTGSVWIRPEHVGPTRKNVYVWLVTSHQWTRPLPINAYVIEHREGLVLFDTGQDRAGVTDPEYFPPGFTGFLYDRLNRFDIGPDQTLTRQLAAIGHHIDDVHTVALSHLHHDHIGGLPELGHARILVSDLEWSAIKQPLPALRGFLKNHIELDGLRWSMVHPEPLADPSLMPFTNGHDLFGDGSLVLLPTPGHTPGSLSLLVRRPGRAPLLMVGDLTYDAELLAAGIVPGAGNKRQLRRTVAAVNELRLRTPGVIVLPAHDPQAARRLSASLTTPTGPA
jgi:glyoxylase-like metal-dependent hydrolase (beta-lactamase superfamily II)